VGKHPQVIKESYMRRTLTALLFILAAAPAVALAQIEPTAEATASPPAGDPLAKENWPLNGVDRPLGLSAGMLQVDVNSNVGMSKGGAGKPISLPLALLYGITNELQFGLVHNTGLCVTSDCAKVYNDLGLQLLFSLFGRGSSLELATTGQLTFTSLDPATTVLQIGGAMNWVVGGNVAILAYPNFGLGLNRREQGNKESFGAPIYAYFRATETVAPVLYTGIPQTLLDGFGDSYAVPVGLGVLVGVNTMLDVGARFDFTNLLGQRAMGVGAADGRALNIWVSLRPL
jgi:hypothetical protein